MNERLTCTKLIAVDRLGSEVWVSSNFQKKNSPPRGSVRVRTTCRGLVRIGSSFHIFALTAGGMSYVEREIVRVGEMSGGRMFGLSR